MSIILRKGVHVVKAGELGRPACTSGTDAAGRFTSEMLHRSGISAKRVHDMNTADVSKATGRLCQDYMQLGAAERVKEVRAVLQIQWIVLQGRSAGPCKWFSLLLAPETSRHLYCPDIVCENNVCGGFGSQSGRNILVVKKPLGCLEWFSRINETTTTTRQQHPVCP